MIDRLLAGRHEAWCVLGAVPPALLLAGSMFLISRVIATIERTSEALAILATAITIVSGYGAAIAIGLFCCRRIERRIRRLNADIDQMEDAL